MDVELCISKQSYLQINERSLELVKVWQQACGQGLQLLETWGDLRDLQEDCCRRKRRTSREWATAGRKIGSEGEDIISRPGLLYKQPRFIYSFITSISCFESRTFCNKLKEMFTHLKVFVDLFSNAVLWSCPGAIWSNWPPVFHL